VFFVFKKIQNNFKTSSAASCILFDANSGNFHNQDTSLRVPPPAHRGAGPPGNPSDENDAGADVHMESASGAASGPPSASTSRRRACVGNEEDVNQCPTSFVAF